MRCACARDCVPFHGNPWQSEGHHAKACEQNRGAKYPRDKEKIQAMQIFTRDLGRNRDARSPSPLRRARFL